MAITYAWRGDFSTGEVNELHAEAFESRVFDDAEWDWEGLVREHSLGWVVARDGTELVGFVNVLWDGVVHAWLQDTMVAGSARHQGVGARLVAVARDGARTAGLSGCTSTSTSTCGPSTSTPAVSLRRAPG